MGLIFISYARLDGGALAERLHAALEPQHRAWLDTREIHGGVSWSTEIETNIDRCDAMIAVLSAGSYRSPVCRGEQLRALRQGKLVVPILASPNADRPVYLEAANFRDFSAPSAFDAQLQLLLGLRGRLGMLLCCSRGYLE